jgi:hypothetical protein
VNNRYKRVGALRERVRLKPRGFFFPHNHLSCF